MTHQWTSREGRVGSDSLKLLPVERVEQGTPEDSQPPLAPQQHALGPDTLESYQGIIKIREFADHDYGGRGIASCRPAY